VAGVEGPVQVTDKDPCRWWIHDAAGPTNRATDPPSNPHLVLGELRTTAPALVRSGHGRTGIRRPARSGLADHRPGYPESPVTATKGQRMATDSSNRDRPRAGAVEQIPDEVWDQFVQELRGRIRDRQASEEARAEFVEMLMDKVRDDPFPSRAQLDLLEQSLPPEMVADYARLLMEKAGSEPFPSNEVLSRIQRMTQPG